MTSALDQHGIHYELQNNGTALAVQSNQTAQARDRARRRRAAGNTQPGFSLFEKSSLGESNFQQQVTYQRALQGQLAQTIDHVQGVSGAQVELVLPTAQSQLFAETQTAPSAAVLLSGTSIARPELGARHRAARGLLGPGPAAQQSHDHRRLRAPAVAGRRAAKARQRTGKQAAEERYDQRDGGQARRDPRADASAPARPRCRSTPTLNTNQTTQESLTYGKSGVPLQQNKNVETLNGTGGGGGAATGTANVPAYAQAAAAGKSNYKHEVTSATLGVNRTVTHSTIAPGAVESQHVSVLLDKTVPATALPAIREAITNAAGIEAKRGDTISIGQMAFAKPPCAARSRAAACSATPSTR